MENELLNVIIANNIVKKYNNQARKLKINGFFCQFNRNTIKYNFVRVFMRIKLNFNNCEYTKQKEYDCENNSIN